VPTDSADEIIRIERDYHLEALEFKGEPPHPATAATRIPPLRRLYTLAEGTRSTRPR